MSISGKKERNLIFDIFMAFFSMFFF